jgi:hypothetical protein
LNAGEIKGQGRGFLSVKLGDDDKQSLFDESGARTPHHLMLNE